MVAYTGNIVFTREGVLEDGIGNLMKKSLTGVSLTKTEGKGKLYLADEGKKVSVLSKMTQFLLTAMTS